MGNIALHAENPDPEQYMWDEPNTKPNTKSDIQSLLTTHNHPQKKVRSNSSQKTYRCIRKARKQIVNKKRKCHL